MSSIRVLVEADTKIAADALAEHIGAFLCGDVADDVILTVDGIEVVQGGTDYLHPVVPGTKTVVIETQVVQSVIHPLKLNTLLHTKDGRITGNAFILSHDGDFYVIETDIGNKFKVSYQVLDHYFWIGPSEADLRNLPIERSDEIMTLEIPGARV